jgi:hypothetical protein
MKQRGLKKVSRGHNRVHECVGIQAIPSAGGKMINDLSAFGRTKAVLTGEQVAFKEFYPRSPALKTIDGLDPLGIG